MADYRKYVIVKELLKKPDRSVYLVKPMTESSLIPGLFVVKEITSDKSTCRELDIHARLSKSSPTILKLYDSWRIDNTYYICIEYCEKEDMHKILGTTKFELVQVLDFSLQLAITVQLMHRQAICHRDIKNLNVFVTHDMKIKLGDFGTSKQIVDTELNSLTGTVPYMSPELLERLNHVKKDNNPYRDDIWALGKTLFEIASGYVIRKNFSCDEFYLKIDERLGDSGIYSEFGALIKDMMSKEKSRFIWIDDVVMRLEGMIQKLRNESLKKFERDPDNYTIDLKVYEGQVEVPKIPDVMKSDLNIISEEDESSSNSIQPVESSLSPSRVQPSIENTKSTVSLTGTYMNYPNRLSNYIVTDSLESNTSMAPNASTFSSTEKNVESPEEKLKFCTNPKIDPKNEVKVNPFFTGNPRKVELQYLSMSSEQHISIIPFKRIIIICCVCSTEIPEKEIEIRCGHNYHLKCFFNAYNKKLENAKRKTQNFMCVSCEYQIGFLTFPEIEIFSKKAKKYAYLQYFSSVKVICSFCNAKTKSLMMNEKLNYQTIKCSNCQIKFCSFCDFRASHRFSCDKLKAYRKTFR